MTPEELQTRPGTPAEARNRRRMAEKYLEVAEEDGAAINVTVGLAALAGSTCQRSSGPSSFATARA